ncbi:hypothetical protein RM780_07725 [Streptomyces sp. DSM 44917]|uniref:Uncharacterized protein n=1 Tax=Streptomyces boetiae TaxID=3075541 RepID=A0ABU2L5X9_9ACTN|nr:hypothetical protein [Streptomyces sp. DSM 44917]MDT0306851.1 hypothetical protein [Streptomyces sp. DSM 44917]
MPDQPTTTPTPTPARDTARLRTYARLLRQLPRPAAAALAAAMATDPDPQVRTTTINQAAVLVSAAHGLGWITPASEADGLREEIAEAIHATSICEGTNAAHCTGACDTAAAATLAFLAPARRGPELTEMRTTARVGLGLHEAAHNEAERWRERAETAEALLRRASHLTETTHALRGQGGHDQLGPDLTCAGCALVSEIRTHLNSPKENTR